MSNQIEQARQDAITTLNRSRDLAEALGAAAEANDAALASRLLAEFEAAGVAERAARAAFIEKLEERWNPT